MSSKKKAKAAPKPVPYHEWVRLKARLYELERRKELAPRGGKKVDRLTKDERSELAYLKKRCATRDDAEYSLLHHCEAIANGVVIPASGQDAVRTALLAAYYVSEQVVSDLCGALVAALETLGVPKGDLKHYDVE